MTEQAPSQLFSFALFIAAKTGRQAEETCGRIQTAFSRVFAVLPQSLDDIIKTSPIPPAQIPTEIADHPPRYNYFVQLEASDQTTLMTREELLASSQGVVELLPVTEVINPFFSKPAKKKVIPPEANPEPAELERLKTIEGLTTLLQQSLGETDPQELLIDLISINKLDLKILLEKRRKVKSITALTYKIGSVADRLGTSSSALQSLAKKIGLRLSTVGLNRQRVFQEQDIREIIMHLATSPVSRARRRQALDQ